MANIPFFKIEYDDNDKKAINAVLDRRTKWARGKELDESIELLNNYYHNSNLCNSGTVALWLILKDLPEPYVIVPDYTYRASIDAILLADKTPIIVDVDKSCFIDTNMVEKVLEQYKSETVSVSVLSVCLYGMTHNEKREKLKYLCDKYRVTWIEDLCQSPGIPLIGDIGALSFVQNKIVNCGEGGAIIYNKQAMKYYNRHSGMIDHGNSEIPVGNNFRLPSLNATLLISQLKRYKEIVNTRKILANYYYECLFNTPGISILDDYFRKDSVHFTFPIIVDDGYKGLMEYLNKNDIDTYRYDGYTTLFPIFKKYEYSVLEYSEYLSNNILLLPLYTSLSKDDIKIICDKIIEFRG